MVVCILRGGLTQVERTLAERGDRQSVQSMRSAFQKAMAGAFTGVVERALGRRVIAFVSQVHIDPDISVETFVLEPRAEYALSE